MSRRVTQGSGGSQAGNDHRRGEDMMAAAGAAHDNNTQAASSAPRPREALKAHSPLVVMLMQALSAVLVVFLFVIPVVIKLYPPVINDVAFLNRLRWPPFIDLSSPSALGLNSTRSFRLDTAPDISVGAWHILPSTLEGGSSSEQPTPDQYLRLLSEGGAPIILYLHGNAGTRAAWHRMQLYKVLSAAGFHVVTFDYRGYGDSLGFPSEEGLVHDSLTVFDWLKQHSGTAPVYIWGHSLGSAVATKTAKRLSERGADFQGLILESPFNNFMEAASNHPFSLPFRYLPWFTWCFIEGIKSNHIRFASDESIGGVAVPTLILHAKDDGVVPYSLGRKLYETALRTKSIGSVEFVDFAAEHGYGHKHIHKAPNLPDIIKKFTTAHGKE